MPGPSARTTTIQPWAGRLVALDVREVARRRDDAIAAGARPAAARCVAAMPTNQLRTTVADLALSERVEPVHIAEALGLQCAAPDAPCGTSLSRSDSPEFRAASRRRL